MARRYMIDSILYWAKEYHIDGFRFDLMGLFDVDTMNEIRAALDKLPRGQEILMYGEPWQGGQSMLRRYEANKANLQMLSTRIGVFSDDTRDAIKGKLLRGPQPRLCGGQAGRLLGHRLGGGGLVPAGPGQPPRPQPDHQLCVGPRQPDFVG